MGGSSYVAYLWRGVYVDKDTRDALAEAARIVGNDIYLRPIPGCGCFQGRTVSCDGRSVTLGSTAASAATHTGAGAVDIDCEGLTDAQAKRVETALRRVGFAAWFRPRVNPYTGRAYGWQRHTHALLMGTALAPEAASQVGDYLAGRDGLYLSHPDTGTRQFVNVRWATYQRPTANPVALPVPAPKPVPVAPKPAPAPAPAARTFTIPKGGTLGKAAVALGVSLSALAGFNHIANPNVVTPGQVVTAPPATYRAPTAAPVKPVVKAAPVVKPAAKPAPVAVRPSKAANKAPAVYVPRHAPQAVTRAHSAPSAAVSRAALKAGASNASVKAFERALAAHGYLSPRWVDGYYGTATSAGVRAFYRQWRVTPWATVPGPFMLRTLNLKFVR